MPGPEATPVHAAQGTEGLSFPFRSSERIAGVSPRTAGQQRHGHDAGRAGEWENLWPMINMSASDCSNEHMRGPASTFTETDVKI